MTAYGRASLECREGRFTAEVQSLNRKFFDLSVQLPKELGSCETELRKLVSSRVFRGKVTLKVAVAYQEGCPVLLVPNLPLASQVKQAWTQISDALELPMTSELVLQALLNEEGVITYEEQADEKIYKEELFQVVHLALDAFIEMKKKEGAALFKDFSQRIARIRHFLDAIQELSRHSYERYREKLVSRLEEILPGSVGNEERILREICLYADRIDISEEITRLSSHLHQFEELLAAAKEEKGKLLEFILQEMGREINTVGSKSDAVEITRQVVAVKGELEKIREQVQNIE